MGRRLAIINADDFGAAADVNQAVILAHQQGILTSTSLMVTGYAWQEAVALAHEHPRLGVGLHLVVVKGQAALATSSVPQLVDSSGAFPNSPLIAGLRYQFSALARKQLAQEVRAQLERFRQTGLPLSHVDGHKHLHCHPVVLGILLDLAAEFQIPLIRLPWEDLWLNLAIDRQHWLEKALHWWVFGQLRKYGRARLQRTGIKTLGLVYGLLQSGQMTEAYLLKLIPQIPADEVEIYFHPCLPNGESQPSHRGGAAEFAALNSPAVARALDAAGFELVNFHQWRELQTETGSHNLS